MLPYAHRGGKPATPPPASATEENIRVHLAELLRHETEAFVTEFSHEIELLRSELGQHGAQAECALERIQSLVADLTERMLGVAREEQPPPVREIGLERALESYCQHVCDKTAVEMSYESEIDESAIDPRLKLIAFRIAQDALDHLTEHRRPSFVSVRLVHHGEKLSLRVEDLGGLCVSEDSGAKDAEVQFLQRLEERVAGCAGQLQVNLGLRSNLLNLELPLTAPRSARAA